MIATLGAQVEVWVYSSPADRKNQAGGSAVRAVVTSGGPPGIAACWARTHTTPPRWLLVRKGKFPKRFEAVEGERP